MLGIDFSRRGNCLVSCSVDRTIRIWDIKTEECLTARIAHADIIVCCVFSQCGQFLASSSWDKTVRIWKIEGF